jgi:hypothetical protein
MAMMRSSGEWMDQWAIAVYGLIPYTNHISTLPKQTGKYHQCGNRRFDLQNNYVGFLYTAEYAH